MSNIGIPFENGGGAGTFGSHFEATSFHNEMMTGTISRLIYFTLFDTALLRDTNWYHSVNESLVDDYNFGRNGGCKFYTDSC